MASENELPHRASEPPAAPKLVELLSTFLHNTPKPLRAVLAVSGGLDSMALLFALGALQTKHPQDYFWQVAHFDHALRPDSAQDAEFTAQIARKLGYPCAVERADWQTSTHGENELRTARYQFLAKTARAHGCHYIFTAHHANDQAETLLLRLLRGTGVHGLAGMRAVAPCPTAPEILLLRPLLHTTRAELEAYVQAENIPFRTDPSNADPRYLRNRIRLHFLPELQSYQPQIVEILSRNAARLQAQSTALDWAVTRAWQDCLQQESANGIAFDRQKWQTLPAELQSALLRRAWEVLAKSKLDELSPQVWENARELGQYGKSGQTCTLGQGWYLHCQAFQLWVAPATLSLLSVYPQCKTTQLALATPPLALGGLLLHWEYLPASTPMPAPHPRHAWLSADHLPATLFVRPARTGERFRPFGMGGKHKELKDFYNQEKIPAEARAHYPLVWAGEPDNAVPVWVVGCRPDERWRVTPATQRILHLWLEG